MDRLEAEVTAALRIVVDPDSGQHQLYNLGLIHAPGVAAGSNVHICMTLTFTATPCQA